MSEVFRDPSELVRKRSKLLLNEARDRLEKCLDINHMLKSIRAQKTLQKLILNEKERILFRYYRSELIEGEPDTESHDDIQGNLLREYSNWEF